MKLKKSLEKQYLPLFDVTEKDNAYRILEANFVDTQTGTGIVHIAPAFGEEDFNLCTDQRISIFDPVGMDGQFTEKVEFLKGMNVFDANRNINWIPGHIKKGRFGFNPSIRITAPSGLAASSTHSS